MVGTGTTGLAALQVGRQFLGVDRAAVSMATDPLSRDL
jgi:DNA modification methylase